MIINATDQKMNDYTYRRYSARCARTTQLYCLDAQDFHSVIVGPRFPIFRMYVARYGVWMRLKKNVVDQVHRIKFRRAKEASYLKNHGGMPLSPKVSPAHKHPPKANVVSVDVRQPDSESNPPTPARPAPTTAPTTSPTGGPGATELPEIFRISPRRGPHTVHGSPMYL